MTTPGPGAFSSVELLLSPQTRREAALSEARQRVQDAAERREREAQLDARREELLGQAMELRARERGGIDPTAPPESFAKPIGDLFAREQMLTQIEAEREQERWESRRPTVLQPATHSDIDVSPKTRVKRRLLRPDSPADKLRREQENRRRRRRGE